MPLLPGFIPISASVVQPPVAGMYPRVNGATSGYFGLKCPAVGPSVDWTMPGADGSSGQFLKTNGSGTLSWGTVSLAGLLVQAPANNAANTVQPTGVAVVPFTIKNIAGQTADAQEWQNSGGTVLAKVDPAGGIYSTVGVVAPTGIGANCGFGFPAPGGGGGGRFFWYNPANSDQGAFAWSQADGSGLAAPGSSYYGAHLKLVYGVTTLTLGGGTISGQNTYVQFASAVSGTLIGSCGSGNNCTGWPLYLCGGLATGNAAGGDVVIQTGSTPGASGSALNTTRNTVCTFSGTNGSITLADGVNIAAGTTNGTKLGTMGGAAGQKLGFFGATPIVQPLLATGAGHTIDDVITTLQSLGLVRQT